MQQAPKLEELESAILAGKEVDEAAFAAAHNRKMADNSLNEIKARRDRAEQVKAAEAEWHKNMEDRRKTFEDLHKNEPKLKALWLEVARAIDAYASAAYSRNGVLAELANYFSQQKTREGNTVGASAPFRYTGSQGNAVSIENRSLGMLAVPDELERCFALTIGKYDPNHLMYLRFGGGAAAVEAGIR